MQCTAFTGPKNNNKISMHLSAVYLYGIADSTRRNEGTDASGMMQVPSCGYSLINICGSKIDIT